ncbi:MAG: ABC transporter permease [Bacteroidota bacterium]|nr:ABC transporter permease [Bacteroidota bacterium]
MFSNYLLIAFRNLIKNKTYSFINVFGLAVGTLCCLYIMLYVSHQFSYDKHHPDAENIYRITSDLKLPGGHNVMASVSPPTAPAMKQDFPEVQQFTRVVPALGIKQFLLHYLESSWYEDNVVYADSTFFEVFAYHFIRGNTQALNDPYSIVITKTLADKMFGSEDPLGKKIEMVYSYGKNNYTVQGVIDESLGKSHIQANIYVTMRGGGMGDYARTNTSWAGNNFSYSYVKLYPNTDVAALESKLPAFLNKYGQDQLKQLGMEKQLHLQPVSSIHTTPGYEAENDKIANPRFLYLLLLIAGLIQVIACINFMNLSTARSTNRAKEVGVRKVIGAGKFQLVRQFLTESVILTLFSILVAVPLLYMTMPALNAITQTDIQLNFITDYRLWILLTALVLFTGLIAGSYPAFYLSAFDAIRVLKGNFTNQVSAAGIRRSLVVFQFVLSILLISGIIVIYSQMNYIKNKDLGFNGNQKLIFTFHTDEALKSSEAFAEHLRLIPEVKVVSRANNYLSQFVFNDWTFYKEGGSMEEGQVSQFMMTDQYFVKANEIKLISGRDFRLNDSGRILINETMARKLSIQPEQAEGTKIFTKQGNDPPISFEIVGVLKDFNFNSLHENVKPLIFRFDDKDPYLTNIIVNLNSDNYKNALKKIEAVWHQDFAAVPFEYQFLDEEVQKQYDAEISLSQIINLFTGMAILISCLGLFGLATFSAEQRRKEIGIRKVLGASVIGLTQLLSKDFLKLVAIAILIATPISWWAMSQWLQSYAYRVTISWWMFALAGLLAIMIALLTIGFQAIKAAIANPVKSIRIE